MCLNKRCMVLFTFFRCRNSGQLLNFMIHRSEHLDLHWLLKALVVRTQMIRFMQVFVPGEFLNRFTLLCKAYMLLPFYWRTFQLPFPWSWLLKPLFSSLSFMAENMMASWEMLLRNKPLKTSEGIVIYL